MKRKIDIENELSDISKTVANLPRENPFSVPENYFETLPLRTTQIELLRQENPFQVPEGYFEQFRVTKPKTKTFALFTVKNFVRYAAAACITGVIVALFFLINNSSDKDFSAGVSSIRQTDISSDAVESYLVDAENMIVVESNNDEFAEPQDNALVDLNSEMVGELLSELSENDLSQYMNLNDFNESITSYN